MVGRDGGFAAQWLTRAYYSDISPLIYASQRSLQAVVWHLMVSSRTEAGRDSGNRSIAQPLRRAVFLDRDGVLSRALVRNGKPYPPASLDELEVLQKPAALSGLAQRGFLLFVVTSNIDMQLRLVKDDNAKCGRCRWMGFMCVITTSQTRVSAASPSRSPLGCSREHGISLQTSYDWRPLARR